MKKVFIVLLLAILLVQNVLSYSQADNTMGGVKITSTEGAVVRSKPSVESEYLGKAEYNQTYNLLEEKNGWYKINYKTDLIGWVHGSKATKVSNYSSSASNTIPDQQKRKLAVGDFVSFGRYPQTVSGEKEPIVWLVLDIDTENNKALLISRFGLDAKPYDKKKTSDTSWETCSLRKWLNGEFFNIAFTEKEQRAILMTTVENDKNQLSVSYASVNPTDIGNNTRDKVFLLSCDEAKKYFIIGSYYDNSKARSSPTDYALLNGAYQTKDCRDLLNRGAGMWWLRTMKNGGVAFAILTGNDFGITNVEYDGNMVRPVIWVNLDTEFFKIYRE